MPAVNGTCDYENFAWTTQKLTLFNSIVDLVQRKAISPQLLFGEDAILTRGSRSEC